MTARHVPPLKWIPYDRRGTRPRVKKFCVRGSVEYELTIEGGRYVIRRTEQNDSRKPTVTEIGRSMARMDVLGLWALIVSEELQDPRNPGPAGGLTTQGKVSDRSSETNCMMSMRLEL